MSRAAQKAGLSLHQMRQALRVANIPNTEFERLVESDDHWTGNKLAALGRRQGSSRGATSMPCPHCGGTGKVGRLLE